MKIEISSLLCNLEPISLMSKFILLKSKYMGPLRNTPRPDLENSNLIKLFQMLTCYYLFLMFIVKMVDCSLEILCVPPR